MDFEDEEALIVAFQKMASRMEDIAEALVMIAKAIINQPYEMPEKYDMD